MPANNAEQRYVRIQLTTSYQKISNGFRRGIGKCSAAWRACSYQTPLTTDGYSAVAANDRQLIVSDGETWARTESGTAYLEIVFDD